MGNEGFQDGEGGFRRERWMRFLRAVACALSEFHRSRRDFASAGLNCSMPGSLDDDAGIFNALMKG